ncbi:MAG: toxic anion resistance protein [Olegusella sp.]|nr:toxic anion resistance protein [Olegusella sp.]
MADQTTPTPEPAPEAEEPILEFGDAAPIPTPKPVTLEVTPEPEPATPAAPAQIDDSILSESEKKQVEEFVDKIDLSQSGAIMQYGVGTQKKMADFSDKTLDSVRTKDLGEMGQEITGLIAQLKGFDPTAEQPKGLMGFFRKQSNKIQELNARYTSIEKNVDNISTELQKHQVQLLKDIDMLDRMYELNSTYFKELTMYVLAGKKKLDQVRSVDLPAAQAKAAETGLAEDAQAARDLQQQCDRFEKRLYDLELTRQVAIQTAPQIRLVQNSNAVMAEKIQSTVVNTIPLWKNQMVIALGVEHATQAAEAQRAVSDMTNDLLKKNADQLKVATVTAAKESERGIVDIETLQHTNEQLISTLDEVMAIQQEGHEKRIAAEAQLAEIEGQLKQKLLEASKS